MAAPKKQAKAKKDTKPRETGTAGQSAQEKLPPSGNLPPDPQTLGRPMTPSEKVDEASLESMDGSDPPSYMPSRSGGPKRPAEEEPSGEIDEDQIRDRAYALWVDAGRPSGRDEEFWHRAQRELREKRQAG
jgi:hypothetical protein